MPRRLSAREFHVKHAELINFAREKLTIAEIARRTGKNPSAVRFLITTARQRGIDIPYKRKTKTSKTLSKAIASIEESIASMKLKPEVLDRARRILNVTSNLSSFPKTLCNEINLPYLKANHLAQLLINEKLLKED